LDTKTLAKYKSRAQVMKALAHPARLYLVDILSDGERCVCDLTRLVNLDTSTVSKHLAVLRNAGIVSDDKRGTQVFYQLRVTCIGGLFDCMENVIRTAARERLKTLSA
jgi:ArsR family transcriptional regulator